MISFLCLLVLLIGAAPLLYYLLSLLCVIDFFRSSHTSSPQNGAFCPPVSIIKAVRGMDAGAYDNFASFCRLDYPNYEVLFGVADRDDSVVPIIQQLQRDFPERTIRLITPIPELGTNNKVNSLCTLVSDAAHDLLVMSDSDVRVDPQYLRRLVAPFQKPNMGAVTCFYRGRSAPTLASRLNALGMAMESAPGAVVARKLEGKVQFAFGWTMATTKQCLSKIGGWEAMANHHSDDFELGNRLSRAGFEVELLAAPVEMIFPPETLMDFLRHELRWSIGLRNVRPAGYWGILLTHGLPWSILASIVVLAERWPPSLAVAYLGAYFFLRLALTATAGYWGLRDPLVLKNLWLVPVRDAISFLIWVAACFTNHIRWRGLDYRVEDGLLIRMNNPRELPR
jgi:ceramide glucosyltransferase